MAWKAIEKYVGRSALSRAERKIADKQDEIARVKAYQFDQVQTVQKRIDEVETTIVGLKKKKLRFQAECAAINEINLARLAQLEAELKELEANGKSLSKSSTSLVPVGTTLEFRSPERSTDELPEQNPI